MVTYEKSAFLFFDNTCGKLYKRIKMKNSSKQYDTCRNFMGHDDTSFICCIFSVFALISFFFLFFFAFHLYLKNTLVCNFKGIVCDCV